MGNCMDQWRVTIGMFYCRCQKIRLLRKVSIYISFSLSYISIFCRYLKILTDMAIKTNNQFLNDIFYFITLNILLIIAGDVERNPGPELFNHTLFVLHQNIRSIRNKFEYIKDTFMDYDILTFTETHLDGNVCIDDILIENYDKPYRKDRTCHGGGLLAYINSNLAHERMDALEIFWNESIWLKIKQNSQFYLFGIFYSPKTSDKLFFERLNQNLEIALDITKNVVIMGDFNEDILNPNNQNLKNVLLINSLNNIITEPTRGRALLDPILISFDQTVLDSGTLQVPPDISDHRATFLTLPFEYNLHYTFKRKIWIYKQANYAELEMKINNFDWSPLHTLPLDEAVLFFNHSFLNLVSKCIPSK